MSDGFENPAELPEMSIARGPGVGVGLAVAALIVPVVAGGALLFVTSFGLSLGISAATVVATALLLAIDAGRLGKIDSTGQERDSAGVLFLGIVIMWIVVYPLAFFRRSRFEGPNLLIPAILVALFFAGGSILKAMLVQPSLPACDSPEVVQLIQQIVRGTPVGGQVKSIDGHRETGHDPVADQRQGRCTVHTAGGDIVVNYLVRWRDRSKGMFEVQINPQ